MECQSCEKIIAKAALSEYGVKEARIDYATGKGEVTYDPNITDKAKILKKIEAKGYACRSKGRGKQPRSVDYRFISLTLGIVLIALFAYSELEKKFDLSFPTIGQDASLGLLFLIGLLTGFHCIAMCGGFVISYTAKNASQGRVGSDLRAHLSYGFGKTASYTLLGGFFGLLGSFITFTPVMRGAAGILAGIFLIMFGLNMLNLFRWFRRFRLKMPSPLEKFIERKSEKSRSPLAIGLLNGLMLACGPLQAVYIFAAASGSAYWGALYLMAFGLGTLPVLLGFGIVSSMVSSQFTHKILKLSGVVVVILGLIMVNRGLALTGSGYDANTLFMSVSAKDAAPVPAASNAQVTLKDGYQEIQMNVTSYGWVPDKFILKKGVPVKWVINGVEITNCNRAIQVPKLGLRFDVKPGLQTIEFTPTEAGTIPWSCWMGMIPGVFIVKDDVNIQDAAQVQTELASVQVPQGGSCGGAGGGCGGGSCGCGCGGGR